MPIEPPNDKNQTETSYLNDSLVFQFIGKIATRTHNLGMATKLNHAVGLRLKAARNSAGLTQEQLAEKVDRTKEAISNIERGHNFPTIETLDRICIVLNIPIRFVFGDVTGNQRRVEKLARIDLCLQNLKDNELSTVADIVDVLKHSYTEKR